MGFSNMENSEQSTGYQAQGSRHRVSGTGFQAQGIRHRVSCTGYQPKAKLKLLAKMNSLSDLS